MEQKHILSGKNIRKSFGSAEILRGIDLDVERGKITVLIGPSGCGKTTLLRALSLLDPPTSGTIDVNGFSYRYPLKNSEKKNFKPPWPEVTAVFQQLFLWPHMTLLKNITLPVKLRKMNVDKRIEELIELFEMEEFVNRYPNEVSLGQKQRAALARALVLNPSFILLDEITSALDVQHTSRLLIYLQKLRDHGIGIFLITHLIGFARRAGNRIAFLDNGEIIETGGPEMIDAPKNERVKQFLSVIKSAR